MQLKHALARKLLSKILVFFVLHFKTIICLIWPFFCQWCIANVVHLKCLLPSISNSIVFQFSISLFFLTVGPYSCCSTVPFSTSSIIFGSWLDPGAKLLSGLEKKIVKTLSDLKTSYNIPQEKNFKSFTHNFNLHVH